MSQDSQPAPAPAPSLGCISAAHRALAVTEILNIIFSFGTQASNVSNVLVCRGWREPALDNVWREVDDIYYLLQLLAPFKTSDHGHRLEFSRIPTLEDWTRFSPYARRVHSLKYRTNVNDKSLKFGDSVFYIVACTRPTLVVLPNLRSLWWNSNARDATVFMHDKVTEFAFQISSEDLPSLRTEIVGRMPYLRSFGWSNPYNKVPLHLKDRDDRGILELLSGLQMLREVAPPKGDLGSKFLKALPSLLPELEAIRFDNLGGIASYSTSSLKGTLQEGAFPKLYDLCLKSDLDDIRVYLTGGALLPRLRNLSVEGSGVTELPPTVQRFLTDVTRRYPTLEMVSMNVIASFEEDMECDPLSREHLNPILSLKQLTHLELRHNQPLQISEVDLAEFGAALPALGKLVLNPEPIRLKRPEITLHSLLIVAQHFPNLIYLGIYLDAQDSAIPKQPYSPAKRRFSPGLLTLHLGVSPIASDSEVPVAMFLSHILSENERVKIKSGILWNPQLYEEGEKYMATVSERCNKWDRVVDSLSLLSQLRKGM